MNTLNKFNQWVVLVAAILMVSGTSALAADNKSSDTGKKMGEHSMMGTVSKVGHKDGKLKLKTPEGTLNLHFPPSDLETINKGDILTVYLSFARNESAAKGKK